MGLGLRRDDFRAKDSRHSSKIIRADEKTQESSKWLFLGNLFPEIESKAPN